MAAKKKAKKSKPKKTKSKVKPKKPALKKTKKKVVKKKAVTKKSAKAKPKAKKAAPKKKPVAKKPKATPKPAAPVTIPGAERIGIVTHYYNHLSVAIIKLETGTLRSGETVHIKGHTSDFRQMVGSMEVDHVHVDQAQAGTSLGLRVNEHAREHDVVYKVMNP